MRHVFLAATALVLGAAPTYAADRYYCAVDDANLKLTVDVGFEEAAGHKLNHFRGALIAKSDQVPEGFRKLVLDSTQLMQNWAGDGELRLAVYAQNEINDPDNNFELLLSADGKDDLLQGSYHLTFNATDQPKPLAFTGKLSCSTRG